MRVRAKIAIALAALGLLALAGCGGDDGSGSAGGSGYGSGGGSGSAATTGASGGTGSAYSSRYGGGYSRSGQAGGASGAVVSIGSNPELGPILVDSNGMTLYDFHKDKGAKSACYGACAKNWPPLTSDSPPRVGNGAKQSLLGTTARRDGTTQVTYAGHPLYTYVGDAKPGDANGNDVDAFGAEWYALRANGAEPED